MSKGSSAPAPDYTGAAQATANGNAQNLNTQTWANRPDQNTPFGSEKWTTSIDQTAYDRAMADWRASGSDPKTRPAVNSYTKWTSNTTLTPEQQAALNAQQQVQMNQSNLAQQMQGQVADQMKNGFTAPQMQDYMNGVGSVNMQYQGFNPNLPGVNANAAGAMASAGSVNQNAPQFSDATAQAGSKAAYDASTALLKDQWSQDTDAMDSKLRMQGLTPGTEAYNNAMQNLSRTQAQQQNQLASQSVMTGNQMANQNYASSLAGYQAGLGAQNQAYSQAANTYNLGNEAQQQAYNQAIASYGANQSAQQQYNAAQAQQYQQAMNNYGTAYQTAYQNYLQPLNSMNAVLSGNQVSMPTMPGFTAAGYTPGADYSGAASSLGQYNSGVAAQNSANNSSTMGLVGSAAMAAAVYF